MSARLRPISHPSHGLEGVDMGAGPVHLLDDAGISADLEAQGWAVESETVETPAAAVIRTIGQRALGR